MAAVIGALRAELSATIAKFQEDMKNAGAAVREFATKAEAQGKRLQRVGAMLSVALTAPLVAFGVKSVQAATEAAQALGQLEAALKSTEFQAGRTLKQLQAQAKALESISTFDDDDILKDVTTNLTKFGNVVGEVFDKAQVAIVDMAARTGDLAGAAQTVGRALNDPIAGITALTRAGVQFTQGEKDKIKALVTSGRGIEAQALILGKLETAYGGAAKALRDATPTAALNQQWRELTEIVGGILIKVLPPIIDLLRGIAEAFNSLSPEMQRLTVYTALFVAALGPLVTLIGTFMRVAAALAPVVAALGAVLAGISAPVWAIVAAVTAAVAALLIFWRAVSKLLQGDFTAAWEEAKKTARDMWDDLNAMFAKEPIQAPVEFVTKDGKLIAPGKTNFNQGTPTAEKGTFPDSVTVTPEQDLSENFRRGGLSAEMSRLLQQELQRASSAVAARRETTQAQEQMVDIHQRRGDQGVVSEEALHRQEIARDLFDQQIAAEERLAQLENERAEAELTGDTESVERLSNLIVLQQQLHDLVKDTTVAQIEEQEKTEEKNKKVKDAFDGFFRDIGDGFKRMAREGEFSLEFLKMALREALFKAFVDPAIDAAINALKQIVKGVFQAIASSFGGGFAEGGFVPPNQWAVVGERGPEMAFSGPRGMHVFSNEDSQQMGAGTVVNVNVRTQDANSFMRTSRQIARQTKRELQGA